ncbi:hypothetical protein AB0M36_34780 [Actinoplanes sp. NPDC051346]|uniref:hypothetical protein n=1 Tax=Actinoplanes sp. NPDC051346 TaxID=3155048 RepID=UPI00344017B7
MSRDTRAGRWLTTGPLLWIMLLVVSLMSNIAVALPPVAFAVALAGTTVIGLVALVLHLRRMLSRVERSTVDLGVQNARAKALVQDLLISEGSDLSNVASGYTEDLTLTVLVGSDHGRDRITERRVTRPIQSIGHRSLTLVHTYAAGGEDGALAEIRPQVAVEADGVSGEWLPLDGPGRGVVVFSPPQFGGEFCWELGYDVPDGLWDPLRRVGLDVFRYDNRTAPIRHFEVQFVIDSLAHAVFVRERNNRGEITSTHRDHDGHWNVYWSAGEIAASALFEWDLRVAWGAGPADKPSAATGIVG